MKQEIFCKDVAEAAGPYVQGLTFGSMVYATQVGIDRDGALVGGGIEAQTRQTMENLRLVLEQAGSSMDKVLKCTIYIANAADKPGMNAVYQTYFSDPFPSRCCVQVAGMEGGALVEMQVEAYI
ncbi:RidA family protein [Butyricicoccus sp. Marseille-Q5471]|uniref:RidA family protein n=1 Tax=Butyricicoccus sp. Marseille-Q5471 TaxID=3039493 RepID=UPI0024BC01F1|nr:RidA family protein [Butyricicoccus sp. Marseille-Q5471]